MIRTVFLLVLIYCFGSLKSQIITTIIGTGNQPFNGNNLLGVNTNIYLPTTIAFDSKGNLYVADYNNYRVRKYDFTTSLVTTYAGSGNQGSTFNGDGLLATSSNITPVAICFDKNDNLYIAEASTRIRKVNATTNIMTTIAGNGTYNNVFKSLGDGGLATNASLSNLSGIVVDNNNNIYFSEVFNVIRKIDGITNIISTFAGNVNGNAGYSGDGNLANKALLHSPLGLTIQNNELYFGDGYNNAVRKVSLSTNVISTVMGTGIAGYSGDGGNPINAQLNYPQTVAFDAQGNMYVADEINSVIRKLDFITNKVSTIAGTGKWGYNNDNILAVNAQLSSPADIKIDASNNIYIADYGNNRIRKIGACSFTIAPIVSSTKNVCVGNTVTLSNSTPSGIWSSSDNSTLTVDANGKVNALKTGNATVYYSVTQSGCTNYSSIDLTGIVNNAIPSIQGKNSVCQNSTIQLTNSLQGGSWITDNPLTGVIDNSGAFTGIRYGTSLVKYFVTQTCGTDTVTTQINVLPKPISDFQLPNKVCLPYDVGYFINTSTIADNSQNQFTYSWIINDPLNPSNSQQKDASHQFIKVGVYNIKLTVTSKDGCIGDTTKSFSSVYNRPTSNFLTNKQSYCIYDTVLISNTSSTNTGQLINWNWCFGNTDSSQLQNPTIVVKDSGILNISLYSYNSIGCVSDTFSQSVLINPLPVYNINSPAYVVQGNNITLSPHYYSPNCSFLWSPSTFLDFNNIPNPTCTPNSDMFYTISSTSSVGCKSIDTLSVLLLKVPIVPNAFSPNGDGVNDTWMIQNLDKYKNCEVSVFNRGGQEIFRSIGYASPWNGTFNNIPVPIGTYYYLIKISDINKTLSGSITLLR